MRPNFRVNFYLTIPVVGELFFCPIRFGIKGISLKNRRGFENLVRIFPKHFSRDFIYKQLAPVAKEGRRREAASLALTNAKAQIEPQALKFTVTLQIHKI